MDLQLDVLVVDGLGHAVLDAVLERVEAPVHGGGDLRTALRTSLCSGVSTSPSGRDFSTTPPPRIRPRQPAMRSFFGSADGSTMTGPLASASRSPVRSWLPKHGRFAQPGFQQVAAAQAGGLALRRNADLDVEAVALLDARPQNALHQSPAPRCPTPARRSGLATSRFCISSIKRGAFRRRRGIAAGAVQTRHQSDRLDASLLHSGRRGEIADQPGVGLLGRRLLGALRSHRQPVPPGAAAEANSSGTGRKQKKISTFHASLHSVAKEKSQRQEKSAPASCRPREELIGREP